ncbi:MAG: phosphoribosylglycinamide formyltransferase [Actinomycetota bacterium]
MLASGSGSNLQAIIDACTGGRLRAEVRVVISNNLGSGALEKASRSGIAALHLSSKTHPAPGQLDNAICRALQDSDVEFVLLAGYMKKLGPRTLERFRGRVLNIHPAPLPRFGGPGMYGLAVHQAVIDSGAATTGASIHVVDEQYDHGPVIAFAEVDVRSDDTPESLAERVLAEEHELYVATLAKIASGELTLPAG